MYLTMFTCPLLDESKIWLHKIIFAMVQSNNQLPYFHFLIVYTRFVQIACENQHRYVPVNNIIFDLSILLCLHFEWFGFHFAYDSHWCKEDLKRTKIKKKVNHKSPRQFSLSHSTIYRKFSLIFANLIKKISIDLNKWKTFISWQFTCVKHRDFLSKWTNRTELCFLFRNIFNFNCDFHFNSSINRLISLNCKWICHRNEIDARNMRIDRYHGQITMNQSRLRNFAKIGIFFVCLAIVCWLLSLQPEYAIPRYNCHIPCETHAIFVFGNGSCIWICIYSVDAVKEINCMETLWKTNCYRGTKWPK